MTLTALQRECLLKMADGAKVHRCVHTNINTNDSYFYGHGMVTVRSTTIHKLLKLGLVEDTEKPAWRWRGSLYAITDEGRKMAAVIRSDTSGKASPA